MAEVAKREVYYFAEPGEGDTDLVVEAVARRLEAEDVNIVLVASNSGRTAARFGRALKGKAKVFCVTEAPSRREWGHPWPTLEDGYRRELEELGVEVIEEAPFVFHNSVLAESKWDVLSPEELVRETLYAFGQGLKVAVEVALMGVACGRIEPYQDVIGVGGSGKGADTAIVVRATDPTTMFAKDSKKRLEVRELIAMPLAKEWWD